MLRSVRLSHVFLIILALLPFFASAQGTPFAVGTASAAPGQKVAGYLEVPAGVDAGTNIPVVVVATLFTTLTSCEIEPELGAKLVSPL